MEPAELTFKPQSCRLPVRHGDRWMALSFALIGALCLSNALWFYNWRVRAVDHHEEIEATKRQAKADAADLEPITYITAPVVEQPAPARLQDNERCRGGIVFRRNGDTLESTGERC